MDLGGAKGGVKSDINVTPLVDVMLVLLIIMMLIAPMLQKGVDVQLPEAGNTVDKPETQEQTVLAVKEDQSFYLNGALVAETELVQRIKDTLESKKQKIVLIKADKNAPYSAIMKMMDQLRAAEIEDIGLITEKKKSESGGSGGGE
jgi:biopolymer transport protein ExbD